MTKWVNGNGKWKKWHKREENFLVYRQKNQCNWKADYQHHNNNNNNDDDECFTCGTKKNRMTEN